MRMRTLGVFVYRTDAVDFLWNQCDERGGVHRGWKIVGRDPGADHILCVGPPIASDGSPRMSWFQRRASKMFGRYEQVRRDQVFGALGCRPSDLTVLYYEPPGVFSDEWYRDMDRHAARFVAPDARCPTPMRLPVLWTIDEHVSALRQDVPVESPPIALSCISSAVSFLPGHAARLRFLRALRRESIAFELFGRGTIGELGGHGPIASKSGVLRSSRLSLVIENHAQDHEPSTYVSEKLWDALLSWSVPLYYGSAAAEDVVPAECMVRLPDLSHAGIEAVRQALADTGLRKRKLEAIAEARRRILGSARLMEWFVQMMDTVR